MKTTTLLHAAKAEDNYAISLEIGAVSPAHIGWQITLLFYSALFWVRAYFAETGIQDKPSHFKRLQTVRKSAELSAIAQYFSDLQDLSEEARYDLPYKDAVDLVNAIAGYAAVKGHITMLLGHGIPDDAEADEAETEDGVRDEAEKVEAEDVFDETQDQ